MLDVRVKKRKPIEASIVKKKSLNDKRMKKKEVHQIEKGEDRMRKEFYSNQIVYASDWINKLINIIFSLYRIIYTCFVKYDEQGIFVSFCF